MNKTLRTLLLAASALLFAVSARAETPAATLTPVAVPDTTVFGATAVDLARFGYVEQEFYIRGTANRYRITNPLGTAEVIDGGHPYTSRILVRRPARAKDFNGIVAVEWYNVTAGQDVDFTFAAMHEHLLRQGYAFVAVSAQLVGINTLRRVSRARYGSLDATASNVDPVTGGKIDVSGGPAGQVTSDVLSWDIFGQTAAALRSPGAVTALGELKPKYLIALGESQSAGRLTAYYNAIQPLHRVYDAFLTYDRMGPLRNDIGTKSISIGTEFSALLIGPPPDDSTDHRWWEVAGSSHVSVDDLAYLDPIIKRDAALRDPAGNALSLTELVPIAGQCKFIPILSRVPTGHVLNAALEQLVAWMAKDVTPAQAPRLARDVAGKLLRDADGRVSGGVRLPAYDAPTAENSGVNSGPGFCMLAGHHVDFSEPQLCDRYKDRGHYLARVKRVANEARNAGFLLKRDQLIVLHDAEQLRFSCAK